MCQPGYRMTKNGTHVHDRLCAICPVEHIPILKTLMNVLSVTQDSLLQLPVPHHAQVALQVRTSRTRAGCNLHDAADDCGICGAGTYAAAIGSDSCTDCPVGTFLADEGTLASTTTLRTIAVSVVRVRMPLRLVLLRAQIVLQVCTSRTRARMQRSTTLRTIAVSVVRSILWRGCGDMLTCDAGTYLADEGTDATLHNSEDLCLPCAKGHHASGARVLV